MCRGVTMFEKITKDKRFDEERAFYGFKDIIVENCEFSGITDGESAFKECKNITVKDCRFELRYPFWHVDKFTISGSNMTETCRAALWYCKNGHVSNTKMHGIKALRECENIRLNDVDVISEEYGWKCNGLRFKNSKITSVYPFFLTKDLTCTNLNLIGKYSFQYAENVEISNSVLNTKDAFWHAKNVIVRNSFINGEYLGWYSENLTLIDCEIIGTQPLCYCENLKLINCKMHDSDLSFEYSDVQADIVGTILSVKNPKSGKITADKIDEIILENSVIECTCEIVERNK